LLRELVALPVRLLVETAAFLGKIPLSIEVTPTVSAAQDRLGRTSHIA
jgi:hypothetical protein